VKKKIPGVEASTGELDVSLQIEPNHVILSMDEGFVKPLRSINSEHCSCSH
jgi:hypothetical protein